MTPGLFGPTPFTNVDPKQPWPLTQQFSFGAQHEFSGNNRVSLSYVGNITVHISQTRNENTVQVNSTTVNVPLPSYPLSPSAVRSASSVNEIPPDAME
jgi:hypothetical protein